MNISKNRRGGAILFLCIIIAAVILIQSILYSGALRRQQEVELRRSLHSQAEHVLSQYNPSLFQHYGVLALHADSIDNHYSVFHSLNRFASDARLQATPILPLKEEDLEKIITGYMRLRFPAVMSCDVADRMSGFFDQYQSFSIFDEMGDKNVVGYIRPLQNFISSTDQYSELFDTFEDVIDLTGLKDHFDEVDDFFDDFRFVIQKQSASIFQAGEHDSLILNFYDPNSVRSFAGFSEYFIDNNSNFMLTHLYVNRYITGHFNSAIQYVNQNGQMQNETNIYGTPYTEIVADDYPYLEFIMTGIDNPDISRFVSRSAVFSVRATINISMCFLDSEKLASAGLLAETISTGIAVASGGSFSIPSPILKYIILVTWGLIDTFSEVEILMNGGTVPLFKHDAVSDIDGLETLLSTSYRDYIGYYLLFVPTDVLLERILIAFQRMTGQSELYSGVNISAQYRDHNFEVTDSYDMYE